jgi:hypothetical protein
MTITLTREEAQQVLDALICSGPHGWSPNLVNQHNKALKTLRARLSAPEPNIVQDAIVYGTGITKDGKRIDPASIYKEPEPPCKTGSQCIGGKCPQCVVSEPEPVAWLYVEGLEALKAGKCWTAYGTKQDDDCRFPVYTAPPQRDFKFSTIKEAKQPMPAPTGQPQLTNDEVRFADAFTTLLKASYGKEAETLLKSSIAMAHALREKNA